MNIKDWKVRQGKCATCPFRVDSDGRHPDPDLVSTVQVRVLSASQICHHPRLRGGEEFELCRGARDYQLEIFHRLGMIATATDAAWEEARL